MITRKDFNTFAGLIKNLDDAFGAAQGFPAERALAEWVYSHRAELERAVRFALEAKEMLAQYGDVAACALEDYVESLPFESIELPEAALASAEFSKLLLAASELEEKK